MYTLIISNYDNFTPSGIEVYHSESKKAIIDLFNKSIRNSERTIQQIENLKITSKSKSEDFASLSWDDIDPESGEIYATFSSDWIIKESSSAEEELSKPNP